MTDADAPEPGLAPTEHPASANRRRAPLEVTRPGRLHLVRTLGALPLGEGRTRAILDRVVRLGSTLVGGTQALLTLVDATELVVVDAAPADGIFRAGQRYPLDRSSCRDVVRADAPLLVADTRTHDDYADEALYGVLAYAGVPLAVGGAVVGTLCVVDRAPRDWPRNTATVLGDLAGLAAAELELRAARSSEGAFASLAGNLPDSICRVGRDLRYEYVNPAFAAAVGRPANEIVGRITGDVESENDLATRWRQDLMRAFERGTPLSTTYESRGAGGGTRWFDVRFVPEGAPGAAAGSVLVVSRDVTARVEAELRLRDREALLRAIVSQAIVGIFTVQDGRFLYANPHLARIFGYDHAESLLALPTVDRVIAPESRARAFELLAEPERQAKGPGHLAFTGMRRDGTRIDVEAHGAVAEVNGRPAIVGMIIDVTQRNALEAQLRQAQKMEAVGQLAAGVAHDFNNLLAAIVANAHLALDDLQQGTLPSAEDLSGILDAANRAAELTRRLLAFGRHEPLRPQPLDLGAVISGMEALLRRILPASVHMEMLTAGPGLPVVADRAQLEQVVMNLVVNARDAMPLGGTITVETLLERHPSLGDVATLLVADTGEGMDARTRERIFEPFFTTKERGRGTGLGLTTVHAAVEQAQGVVTVDSVPGRGSTFRIQLPIAARSAERRSPAPGTRTSSEESAVAGAPPIVLLAEDEEAVRRTSKRMLERAGYHVLSARHGADALRVLDDVGGAVDVLVTDVSMPELDGVSLATRARQRLPGLGVVLVSGYTDILNDATLRSLDAEFLPKPFSAEQLVRAVACILARYPAAKGAGG